MPGDPGPAVIAAHVIGGSGPGVFYDLKDMEPGDEIRITDADDMVHSFVAEAKEMTDKNALPTDRIWNDTTERVLRLITCGGEWSAARRSHLSNWTVYASFAGTSPVEAAVPAGETITPL
jgi:sortase (surface protein transpeptidase)